MPDSDLAGSLAPPGVQSDPRFLHRKGMMAWISQGLEKVVPQPELRSRESPAAEQVRPGFTDDVMDYVFRAENREPDIT